MSINLSIFKCYLTTLIATIVCIEIVQIRTLSINDIELVPEEDQKIALNVDETRITRQVEESRRDKNKQL
jgi:hypothetical protein